MNKYIKLQHKIEGAHWDKEAGKWRLKVRNMETDDVFDDEAHFFINAGGVLSKSAKGQKSAHHPRLFYEGSAMS